MSGFWSMTPAGHEMHIKGDPDMPKEELAAIHAAMDAYVRYDAARTKGFNHIWGDALKEGEEYKRAIFYFRLGADWYRDVWQKHLDSTESE